VIVLKSKEELELMRTAGRIHARVMKAMGESIVAGKTTAIELDTMAHQMILDAGATPSFLGYGRTPFPNTVCISINEAVVHGIPDKRVLQNGDIVGLDLGVCYQGFHVDSAWTYPVGDVKQETLRLLNITREALYQGIAKARAGNRVGDISSTIQKYCESHGYGIVRDLVGHGIGRTLHEEPSVPNYGKAGKGETLREGMTICIEPMVNLGTGRVKEARDGWTIVTGDGKPSAHFEHTIAVTKDGPEILTAHEE
jgi:methionyl aminopeptidase